MPLDQSRRFYPCPRPPRRVLIRPNGTAPARVPLLLREARVSLSLSLFYLIYFELVDFIPLVKLTPCARHSLMQAQVYIYNPMPVVGLIVERTRGDA